jgi:hypothetical protein
LEDFDEKRNDLSGGLTQTGAPILSQKDGAAVAVGNIGLDEK